MQADITAKVFKQAHEPLVMSVALVALEDGGNTPFRATFTEEVEYQQIAFGQVPNQFIARILCPSLNDPDSLMVYLLHFSHNGFSRRIKVNTYDITPLMERIH